MTATEKERDYYAACMAPMLSISLQEFNGEWGWAIIDRNAKLTGRRRIVDTNGGYDGLTGVQEALADALAALSKNQAKLNS